MQINKQTDYAIRTIIALSHKPFDTIVMTKDIAVEQDIPVSFLQKVIQTLSKTGLIITVRGSRGGIKLTKSPDEITLRQVVEAMEGPIFLNRCLVRKGECSRDHLCLAHKAWEKAQKALLEELESIKFSQLT